MKRLATVLLLLSCHFASAGTGDVLRTVAELNAAIGSGTSGLRYDVTATLLMPPRTKHPIFYAADRTGSTAFGLDPAILPTCPTNAGDILHIEGIIVETAYKGKVGLHSERIARVSRGDSPKPIPASSEAIYGSDSLRNRLVAIDGMVHDAFRDEIDHPWSFLVLNCKGSPVYVAVYTENIPTDELERLIGAEVSVTGIVTDQRYGSRVTLKRFITAQGLASIHVLSPGSDPFTVPEYEALPFPQSVPSMEFGRRRIGGHVTAVWNGGSRILVRSDAGDMVRADLKSQTPPRYGEHVEVSGFPATDLYSRNLSGATWRKTPGARFEEDSAQPICIAKLFTDEKGHTVKRAAFYGRAITIRGIVRGLPPAGTSSGRMYMENESFMISVDASGCPNALDGVTVGCEVSVSGIYIIETDNWLSSNLFPQIKETLVAVRTPQDVKIVARPPWWTPGRLMALIGALFIVLLAIFAWNVALRRRAERRGMELAAEQVAHVSSELKVYERTRLAVELHDSLSQTLTGVSMGIDSAIDLAQGLSDDLKRQLEYTSKTVEACRTELKNCLWDLRSEALEATDMNEAIKLALGQIVKPTALAVRFNVPRAQFSDKTAHTILRIIRELATNAIRHGHATEIKIAGSIDGETLRFSVRDNGCGFDFDLAPGIAEGHFGLQGIQERLDLMDGDMAIESAPGKGTKVTVAIRIPAGKTTGET